MSQAFATEMIVALAVVVIVSVGLPLSWVVFRRWEAWSERRGRKRSPASSVAFRAIADRMVLPEQFSRKRR
jgi:hypothetical protein